MCGGRTALLLLSSALLVACAGNPDKRTLADLHGVEPDVTEVEIQDGLDQAMVGYQNFLEQAPESALTPEAMRRLADLKLEKEYGYLGPDGATDLPAPKVGKVRAESTLPASAPAAIAMDAGSERELEHRAAAPVATMPTMESPDAELPGGEEIAWAGPLEAIELYDKILETYPTYEFNDWVLYQKARAFDELGRTDEAIAVIERLIREYPGSRYTDEVQFRRAEYFFTRKRFLDAEEAYAAITATGPVSEYYELALYKLGWTLYKQELHEEALDQYVALLDYKVSTGYDFDQSDDETSERRVADTFRVISLSFSSLGGPESIESYFGTHGTRLYEDRIYSHLGEFYLDKLRYNDAALAYKAFVDLHPLHKTSPRFSMRMVAIYEKGGFPKLVLESKKDFAARYGLQSDYWVHFAIEERPEVLADLKGNLGDLANHYHALYQEVRRADEKPENFREALTWYREYLASFPSDEETPSVHYRMADLLLEDEAFASAAIEYERTAYEYPPHEKSAAAGYAAIFAHREAEKSAPPETRAAATQLAVASTLRFVDVHPDHEHAAVVLGAAVDDLYEMGQLEQAMATAHRLLDAYPDANLPVRRSAFAVVAHSSFDLGRYVDAEQAYSRVLEMTDATEDSHQAVVDSLAASIYKQGEQSSAAGEHRAAADHFLRIAEVVPTSEIRPVAEYDAASALIEIEDWTGAAAVLETFRSTHPGHALHKEATKQMALVYREQGDDARAAKEYERVAAEADEVELRREALLLAGELYESAEAWDSALGVYHRFIQAFPDPLEVAVETRFKIAEIHRETANESLYHEQLQKIVKIDRRAGPARTPRIRFLAAQSALVLSERYFEAFRVVRLNQPFEKSLARKQARMDEALAAFDALVDYEVAEVTAGATYYMAEIYFDFSQALMESERPDGLSEAELLDYELVLEEEAFPFEELAIEVHEKNLELLSIGVFSKWVERSLVKLAEMMPGRYAKFESSPGLITSIDRYAYRAPVRKAEESEAPEPSPADPVEPVPAAIPDADRESASIPTPSRQLAAR